MTEEEKEQIKNQKAALLKAQQLMKECELPEGVELNSDLDEEEEESSSIDEIEPEKVTRTLAVQPSAATGHTQDSGRGR